MPSSKYIQKKKDRILAYKQSIIQSNYWLKRPWK